MRQQGISLGNCLRKRLLRRRAVPLPQGDHAQQRQDVVIVLRLVVLARGLDSGTGGGQITRIQVSQSEVAVTIAAKTRAADFISNPHAFQRALYGLRVAPFIYQHFCQIDKVSALPLPVPDLAQNCQRLLVVVNRAGGLP